MISTSIITALTDPNLGKWSWCDATKKYQRYDKETGEIVRCSVSVSKSRIPEVSRKYKPKVIR